MSDAVAAKKLFKDLPISTQTIMVYFNCTFDINNIFNKIAIENVENIKDIKGEHGKIYQIKRAGSVRGAPTKKGNFRNQINVYMYIIDKMITIKIFPTGKFHLTGCKSVEHQQESVIQLTNAIRRIHSDEEPTYVIEDGERLNAILEVVMINIDFKIDYDINLEKLDKLMQQYDVNYYTKYEMINTSVNIKLDYDEPEVKEYQKIIIEGAVDDPKITYTTVNECSKIKGKRDRTHTFLVFGSNKDCDVSKVIQSGRYYSTEMTRAYENFYTFVMKNRPELEIVVDPTLKFDVNKLIGLN